MGCALSVNGGLCLDWNGTHCRCLVAGRGGQGVLYMPLDTDVKGDVFQCLVAITS